LLLAMGSGRIPVHSPRDRLVAKLSARVTSDVVSKARRRSPHDPEVGLIPAAFKPY
jgi:hypothetical protein